MTMLSLLEHPRHTDHLRLRDGSTLTVRLVAPDDGETLQDYFRGLSAHARYNRFLGGMSELPASELDHFVHAGENDRFSVIATVTVDGRETIVGEARYGFEAVTAHFEFGISIDDRWQGHGIGSALIGNLECRAAALSATTIFGDTLRSNEVMISLARKMEYVFTRQPDDWKLVRFEKAIDPVRPNIPCASWKLVRDQRVATELA
jgi:GNAT superfamily N-acetyltransferase